MSPDDVEAVKWYTKSAVRGYSAAQLSLSRMYERGRGVPRDLVQAYAWTLIAQKNNHPLAATRLEKLRRSMTDEEVQRATAVAKTLTKSAN